MITLQSLTSKLFTCLVDTRNGGTRECTCWMLLCTPKRRSCIKFWIKVDLRVYDKLLFYVGCGSCRWDDHHSTFIFNKIYCPGNF